MFDIMSAQCIHAASPIGTQMALELRRFATLMFPMLVEAALVGVSLATVTHVLLARLHDRCWA